MPRNKILEAARKLAEKGLGEVSFQAGSGMGEKYDIIYSSNIYNSYRLDNQNFNNQDFSRQDFNNRANNPIFEKYYNQAISEIEKSQQSPPNKKTLATTSNKEESLKNSSVYSRNIYEFDDNCNKTETGILRVSGVKMQEMLGFKDEKYFTFKYFDKNEKNHCTLDVNLAEAQKVFKEFNKMKKKFNVEANLYITDGSDVSCCTIVDGKLIIAIDANDLKRGDGKQIIGAIAHEFSHLAKGDIYKGSANVFEKKKIEANADFLAVAMGYGDELKDYLLAYSQDKSYLKNMNSKEQGKCSEHESFATRIAMINYWQDALGKNGVNLMKAEKLIENNEIELNPSIFTKNFAQQRF